MADRCALVRDLEAAAAEYGAATGAECGPAFDRMQEARRAVLRSLPNPLPPEGAATGETVSLADLALAVEAYAGRVAGTTRITEPQVEHSVHAQAIRRALQADRAGRATVAPSVPAAPGDDFCCTSAAWHWLYQIAQAGLGEVRFGIAEDGDTGLWWDAYCGGEWTLGVGDTAEEAVASAMRRHPNPGAEPVVDEQTHARWQAWRTANTPAPSAPDATREDDETDDRELRHRADLARQVKCPHCGALPGARCTEAGRDRVFGVHAHRLLHPEVRRG